MMLEGIDVSIVSFYMQYPKLLFPGKSQTTNADPPAGMTIKSLISSVNPLSWLQAASFIIKQRPDFIIIRYWLPFMAPALSTIARRCRKAGIRVIAITDNIIPHEKRPGDTMLTKYFVNSCDAFIAMSRSVADELTNLTSKPVTFTPHPVYDIFGTGITKKEARKKLGIPVGEKLILFFGFIRPYKGLDLLLNAMADEKVKKLKVKLVVAGEFYGDEEKYKSIVQETNIGNNVIFHSAFIPKEEVKNFFCAADVVVQPYRNATQSGITQIAYHFERPMIVTNVGGLPEIVPDGRVGYVVNVDEKEIAQAIFNFYSLNKEEQFSLNTSAEKERFTWRGFVRNLMKSL